MAGHQPRPRRSAPQEPPAGSLRSTAPQEPPATPAMLQPPACPHRAKPQEKPPIGVGRPKCPTNKNNDKIHQIGSSKVIMNEGM
jgi:hypothetical protein